MLVKYKTFPDDGSPLSNLFWELWDSNTSLLQIEDIQDLLNSKKPNIFSRIDPVIDVASYQQSKEFKFENQMIKKYCVTNHEQKKLFIDTHLASARTFLNEMYSVLTEKVSNKEFKHYYTVNKDSIYPYKEILEDSLTKEFLKACHLLVYGDYILSTNKSILKGYLVDPYFENRNFIKLFEYFLLSYNVLLSEISFPKYNEMDNKPDFIKEMIKQNRLYPDGRRVVKNLSDVLDYLCANVDPVTPQFIVETFLQKNGKKYTIKTAREELNRIKK